LRVLCVCGEASAEVAGFLSRSESAEIIRNPVPRHG
jgi:hypothetical protein